MKGLLTVSGACATSLRWFLLAGPATVIMQVRLLADRTAKLEDIALMRLQKVANVEVLDGVKVSNVERSSDGTSDFRQVFTNKHREHSTLAQQLPAERVLLKIFQ